MSGYGSATSSVSPEPGPWQEVAEIVGDLSQRVWWSGWLRDIEHMAWEWVERPETAPVEAREQLPRLRQLAEDGGHWVRWTDDRGIVPVQLDRWRRRHADWLVTHPNDGYGPG